jgi:streptogramin lyase
MGMNLKVQNSHRRLFPALILSMGLVASFLTTATPAHATFNPLISNKVLLSGANNISNVYYDGTNLWAVSFGSNQVFKINPITGVVDGNPLTVGSQPSFVLAVGDFLFVAATGTNTVTKINMKSNSVVGTVTLGGNNISYLTYDGTKIWATSFSAAKVYSFDPTTLAVSLTSLTVGAQPVKNIVVGDFLFVAATGSTTVTKIDMKSNSVVGTVTLGGSNISNLIYEQGTIWATSYSAAKVYSFDPTTLAVSSTVLTVGSNPGALSAVGDFLFVSATGANASSLNHVTKINMKTNSVSANIKLQDASNISNLIYDGKNLWAVSFGTGKIYQINPTDNSVSTTLLSVGSNPANAVQIDNNIWVAGTGDNSVTNFPIPIVTGTPTVATLSTQEVKLSGQSLNSTLSLEIPAGSLPTGTVVTISPLTSDTGLNLPKNGVFHSGYNIVWKAPNQGANELPPESTVPLTLTVTDPAIKSGDSIFELLNGALTSVGEATQNGKLTFKFSRDPIYAVGRLTSEPPATVSIAPTPTASELNASAEANARAANEAVAARIEAEKKSAREEITNKLISTKDLSVDTFNKAQIPGITASNLSAVQAELLALPEEVRTDINQILKVARKYEIVGNIGSDRVNYLQPNTFVEIGLIPATSKNKVALLATIKKLPESARDTYAEIKAAIDIESKNIQARKDRLAAIISRNASRYFR